MQAGNLNDGVTHQTTALVGVGATGRDRYLWSHLFLRRRQRLQAETLRKADDVAAADAGGENPPLEWLC